MVENKKLSIEDLNTIAESLKGVEESKEAVLFISKEKGQSKQKVILGSGLSLNRISETYLVINLPHGNTSHKQILQIDLSVSQSNESESAVDELDDNCDFLKEFSFYCFGDHGYGKLLYERKGLDTA